MWSSYFRHDFEIWVLDTLSPKIILFNQVLGIVGSFSKLKYDMLNNHDGYFQYPKHGQNIISLGMRIPHFFDVPMERKNLTKEDLSKKIPDLFLQNYTRISLCMD